MWGDPTVSISEECPGIYAVVEGTDFVGDLDYPADFATCIPEGE